jgi:hypothetical protein
LIGRPGRVPKVLIGGLEQGLHFDRGARRPSFVISGL